MTFNDKIKERLSNYKKINFPDLEDGQWKKNKKYYPHILPEDNWNVNLLPKYRTLLIEYMENHKQQIKMHSDFHHLNSSQALCLNFFFPFYYENQLELITNFLGFKNEKIDYGSVRFEKKGYEAELGSKQPTSFDFYFETMSGKKLYFEIKYTELEFGKENLNKNTQKKIKKFEKYYLNSLKSIRERYHKIINFSENYQILRNLIHIDESSYVIFLFPQNNHGIRNSAEKVKTDLLIPCFHDHFFSIYWEKLFENVYFFSENENIKTHLVDFKEKYF